MPPRAKADGNCFRCDCGGQMRVRRTVVATNGRWVRRSRICRQCGQNNLTVERPVNESASALERLNVVEREWIQKHQKEMERMAINEAKTTSGEVEFGIAFLRQRAEAMATATESGKLVVEILIRDGVQVGVSARQEPLGLYGGITPVIVPQGPRPTKPKRKEQTNAVEKQAVQGP